MLVCQLYEAFDAREHHVNMEREVMMQLEEVKMELEPLEQVSVISSTSKTSTTKQKALKLKIFLLLFYLSHNTVTFSTYI